MASSDDKKQYSPGMYLKSQREKKGLSLQDIHKKTRIRPEVIESIESGKDLPSPTYLKGFLKIYARVLDLDEAKLLREFFKKKPTKISSTEKRSSKKPSFLFSGKEVFLIVPVFLLAVISFFVFQNFKEKEKELSQDRKTNVQVKNKIKKRQVKNLKKTPLKTEGLPENIKQGVYTKTLMIQSQENIIMYFKTDGGETVTKPLQGNVWYVIKAIDKIYIRVDGKSYLNFVHEGLLLSFSSETNFERTF